MNVLVYLPSVATSAVAITSVVALYVNNRRSAREHLREEKERAEAQAKRDQKMEDMLSDIQGHLGNGKPGLIHQVNRLDTVVNGLYCVRHGDYDQGRLQEQVKEAKEDIDELKRQTHAR